MFFISHIFRTFQTFTISFKINFIREEKRDRNIIKDEKERIAFTFVRKNNKLMDGAMEGKEMIKEENERK